MGRLSESHEGQDEPWHRMIPLRPFALASTFHRVSECDINTQRERRGLVSRHSCMLLTVAGDLRAWVGARTLSEPAGHEIASAD